MTGIIIVVYRNRACLTAFHQMVGGAGGEDDWSEIVPLNARHVALSVDDYEYVMRMSLTQSSLLAMSLRRGD